MSNEIFERLGEMQSDIKHIKSHMDSVHSDVKEMHQRLIPLESDKIARTKIWSMIGSGGILGIILVALQIVKTLASH
jgi:hypothetical protein